MPATLDPERAELWPTIPFEDLFALSPAEVEPLQLQALRQRFGGLRNDVVALQKLSVRQGVDDIKALDDVVPVLFDHRVLKSYPLSLIERRDFKRLTSWLNRLTTRDLLSIPLSSPHRDEDLTRWFAKLAQEYRGQKVWIAGLSAEMTRLATKGVEEGGARCQFAPGTALLSLEHPLHWLRTVAWLTRITGHSFLTTGLEPGSLEV
jgi:hypothetical protein